MRLEINRAAAAAGKHILCEKPVGRFPEETLRSADAAQAAGVLTFVGFNYRWAPVVQYARKLIQEGKLGQITHYHGRFLNGYAGNPNGFLSWRFDEAQGLGTLGDLMSHAIEDWADSETGRALQAAAIDFVARSKRMPEPADWKAITAAAGFERVLARLARPSTATPAAGTVPQRLPLIPISEPTRPY